MFYSYDDKCFEYEVTYSNRKSVEIRIEPGGLVKLKVPKKTSDQVIEDVLKKKLDWIDEKIEKLRTSGLPVRSYEHGENVLYLGKKLRLNITHRNTDRGRISLVDNELVLIIPSSYDSATVKEMIIALYKKLLNRIIKERIHEYQKHFKFKVNKISIRDQKTRWGSCSSARNLSFNYRLMMAPIEVIDYIVVHEMCHLEHMNHSKSFWKKVHEVMPDYKKHEKFLKEKGFLLNLDWKVDD